MPTREDAEQSEGRSEMDDMRRDLQGEALLLAVPGLYLASLILIQVAAAFPTRTQAYVLAIGAIALSVMVLTLRKLNYLAAAWTLVAGLLALGLAVVDWAGFDLAVYLIALPAGLTALLVSTAGGVLVAVIVTLLLLGVPNGVLPHGEPLRSLAMIGVWGTLGLIWLTTRPLLTTLTWSWAQYEQNRRLLEQARDYQVQLGEALDELAEANQRLTRLNRLATAAWETAEETRRAKEQFVANVSHELRTPLNMIIGFSELILGAPHAYGDGVPPALLADLSVIHRNSQHLSSLIDDVLDLSQIEAGKMALTKERVQISEIVEAAMLAVRPLFASKGLYLTADVPEGLPPILCDPTRLREVVLNLLSNAGRFTEHGGVRVRIWQEGSDLLLSVADTGPGIAREDLDKIFLPFKQLDGSIRRRYGGTGLGLTISRSFVELHGGRLWVESQKGVGTTFYCQLPVDPPAPTTGTASRWLFNPLWEYQERPRRRRLPPADVRPRFVVLEPGDSLSRLLTRYLDGVEIAPARTLAEAVREVSRLPARALLVNDVSVTDTLRRLDETGALPDGVPAIVCSVPGVHEAADALGVSSYLVKPVGREALLSTLARLKLKGRTVLIVDDEPEALQLFHRMLVSARRRYRVLRAGNAQEALEILREQRPDVILIDLVMPEMDGFRLLELRSRDPRWRDIPVVVISARDPAGHMIVSNSLGIMRGGHLSTYQLLSCIEAVSRILSTVAQTDDPVRLAEGSD